MKNETGKSKFRNSILCIGCIYCSQALTNKLPLIEQIKNDILFFRFSGKVIVYSATEWLK